MSKQFLAILAAVSLSACTSGPSWLFAPSPHDRAGWALAAGASASDAPASEAVAVVHVRLDGQSVPAIPLAQARFDTVGSGSDRLYRATYDFDDPGDAEACRVTLTLVAARPFDHPGMGVEDVLQVAFQVSRSAKGNQVSRQSVFMGEQIPAGMVRIADGRLAVNLEQRSSFAGFDLSTVILAAFLPLA